MHIDLPPSVRYALERLKRAGHEAVIIGGCVRDALLGKAPDDFDIATSATPEEVKAVFARDRTVDTGLKHGTVTLLRGGNPIEITTFRIDGTYTDARRPDNVVFTRALSMDILRRDFTINAMAYDPEAGLIDEVGGAADLRAGVIRCVGAAEARFSEDALRILRALRFAATLDFQLEARTERALLDLSGNLSRIAAERLYAELLKLILGAGAGEILKRYRSVFAVFIPGIGRIECAAYRRACSAVDAVEQRAPVRLAAYLTPLGPERASDALMSLRADNRTISHTAELIGAVDRDIRTPVAQRKLIGQIGYDRYDEILSLKAAYGAQKTSIDDARAYARQLRREDKCLTIRQLAVNGADLTARGLRGAAVGDMLNQLLDAVIEDALPNDRERLLIAVDERCKP